VVHFLSLSTLADFEDKPFKSILLLIFLNFLQALEFFSWIMFSSVVVLKVKFYYKTDLLELIAILAQQITETQQIIYVSLVLVENILLVVLLVFLVV